MREGGRGGCDDCWSLTRPRRSRGATRGGGGPSVSGMTMTTLSSSIRGTGAGTDSGSLGGGVTDVKQIGDLQVVGTSSVIQYQKSKNIRFRIVG